MFFVSLFHDLRKKVVLYEGERTHCTLISSNNFLLVLRLLHILLVGNK